MCTPGPTLTRHLWIHDVRKTLDCTGWPCCRQSYVDRAMCSRRSATEGNAGWPAPHLVRTLGVLALQVALNPVRLNVCSRHTSKHSALRGPIGFFLMGVTYDALRSTAPTASPGVCRSGYSAPLCIICLPDYVVTGRCIKGNRCNNV